MIEFNAQSAKELTESYKMTHYGDELQKILNEIRKIASEGFNSVIIETEPNSHFWIIKKLKELGYCVNLTTITRKLQISWP